MKIGRIQNQIINSNLVRNVKKVVKPAVLTAAVALGGLAAGGCETKNEEPRFYCQGCDYIVYPGTDLNVAHETLYKQFDFAENKNQEEDIMESAALLEIGDSDSNELISGREIRNLEGWSLGYSENYVVHGKHCNEPAMHLHYKTPEDYSRYMSGSRIFISPKDLPKCKIDENTFMFGNIFSISKRGNADITIKGSNSNYEVEISGLDRVRPSENNHITINGDGIKYLKISDSKISSIAVVNRSKDINIDLVNVSGKRFSPISIYKKDTKSHININAIDSKYEFESIPNYRVDLFLL